jgi:hypothetical protein
MKWSEKQQNGIIPTLMRALARASQAPASPSLVRLLSRQHRQRTASEAISITRLSLLMPWRWGGWRGE